MTPISSPEEPMKAKYRGRGWARLSSSAVAASAIASGVAVPCSGSGCWSSARSRSSTGGWPTRKWSNPRQASLTIATALESASSRPTSRASRGSATSVSRGLTGPTLARRGRLGRCSPRSKPAVPTAWEDHGMTREGLRAGTEPASPDRWALAAIAGVVLYVALDVALVFLRPRFSVLHNAESDYGSKGRFAWVMDANFLLRCALSLAVVKALARLPRAGGRSRAGLVALATWAVTSGLLAFFPDDPVGTK